MTHVISDVGFDEMCLLQFHQVAKAAKVTSALVLLIFCAVL